MLEIRSVIISEHFILKQTTGEKGTEARGTIYFYN
jgi:hypothetical protein